MVPGPPTGWKQRFSADLVIYEAPDSRSRIRCFQALPLEGASRVTRRVVPANESAALESLQALVTGEGEYGAIARTKTRVIGIVFGDTTAIAIEALAHHEATVRELLFAWKLQLGVRARRCLYRPPPGWTPMTNALATTWFPPGFPDEHALLVVYPASPFAIDAHDELAQLLAAERASGVIVGEIRESAFATEHGLAGQHWSIEMRASASAPIVMRELVSLRRAPYRYAIKLEATLPGHRETALELARSVRAIPPAGSEWVATGRASFDASAHWAE